LVSGADYSSTELSGAAVGDVSGVVHMKHDLLVLQHAASGLLLRIPRGDAAVDVDAAADTLSAPCSCRLNRSLC
jgi:hypothetical protein